MAIVDKYTQASSIEIKGEFNEVMSISRTLTDALAQNIEQNDYEILPANKNLIINTLKRNPNFVSVWYDWELNFVDPEYSKKNGRTAYLAYKKSGEYVMDHRLMDTTDNIIEGDYYFVRENKVELLGEPYYDEITAELKDILLVSPIVPIIIDEIFCGVVGIDLDMRRVQQYVKEIKPYDQSVAFLTSPKDVIVGHTDEKNYNRSIYDVYPDHKKELDSTLNNAKKNIPSSFIYENSAGEEVFVCMHPISIGRDNEMWALTTETPLKEIMQKSKNMFYRSVLIGFLGILILSALIYIIINNIINKLKLAVSHSIKIANGDLSSRIEVTGKNEIASLGMSLNQMADKLNNILVEISNASDLINSNSKEINNYSSEISQSAANQAASIEEIMASIEEMTSNILNNSDNAKQTEIIAEKALKGITNGSLSAHQTSESINKIARNISIIHEIAHQTNILSLNAAVEAARAGANGKGFAVVANEVKKLAEKAQNATKQISSLSTESVHISDLAEKELTGLLPDIEKTTQLIREIANASTEQSHGATQIQNVIQQLNDIAQKNAMHSEQLSVKAQNLLEKAVHLKRVMAFFKS